MARAGLVGPYLSARRAFARACTAIERRPGQTIETVSKRSSVAPQSDDHRLGCRFHIVRARVVIVHARVVERPVHVGLDPRCVLLRAGSVAAPPRNRMAMRVAAMRTTLTTPRPGTHRQHSLDRADGTFASRGIAARRARQRLAAHAVQRHANVMGTTWRGDERRQHHSVFPQLETLGTCLAGRGRPGADPIGRGSISSDRLILVPKVGGISVRATAVPSVKPATATATAHAIPTAHAIQSGAVDGAVPPEGLLRKLFSRREVWLQCA